MYTAIVWLQSKLSGLIDIHRNNVKNVLFIPFALAHHEDYTNKIKGVLADWGWVFLNKGQDKKKTHSEFLHSCRDSSERAQRVCW